MNDTEIAKAQRDFELKKAAYDVEVQTKVSFITYVYVCGCSTVDSLLETPNVLQNLAFVHKVYVTVNMSLMCVSGDHFGNTNRL